MTMELLQVLTSALKELLPVILGFLLATIPLWLQGNRRKRAHWAAMLVELRLCSQRAQTYISDNVAAPLYRLPTRAFSAALQQLIVDGELDTNELAALTLFLSHAEDINRGLDQAAKIYIDHGHDYRLVEEFGLLRLKAGELLERAQSDGTANLYAAAHEVVRLHVRVAPALIRQ
jgi:hypothetical protein